jgi:hypothetical protein
VAKRVAIRATRSTVVMVGNRREYITGRDHAHSKQCEGSVPSGSTPLDPAVAENNRRSFVSAENASLRGCDFLISLLVLVAGKP